MTCVAPPASTRSARPWLCPQCGHIAPTRGEMLVHQVTTPGHKVFNIVIIDEEDDTAGMALVG